MENINSIEETDNIINDFINEEDENTPEIIKQDNPQSTNEANNTTEDEVEEDITSTEDEVDADQETEEVDWKAKYEKLETELNKAKKRYSDSSQENSRNQKEINANRKIIGEYEKKWEDLVLTEPTEENYKRKATELYSEVDWEELTPAARQQVKNIVAQERQDKINRLKDLKSIAITKGKLQMEEIIRKFPDIQGREQEFLEFVEAKDPNRMIEDLTLYGEMFNDKLQLKKQKQVQKGSTLLRSTYLREAPKPKIDQDKIKELREKNPREWEKLVKAHKI